MSVIFYHVLSDKVKILYDVRRIYSLAEGSFLVVFGNGSSCIMRDFVINGFING